MNNDRDGFIFASGPLNRNVIIIEDQRIDDYVNYINQNDIRSIYFNSGYYYLDNVDCLKRVQNIETINIGAAISNFDGLYRSSESVKVLLLGDITGPIDLLRMKCVEEMAIDVNKYVLNLEKCKQLKELRIWKYKKNNLEELSGLTNLNSMAITQSSLVTLDGCNRLNNLKQVELNYMSKLEDVNQLTELADTLKVLRIESCKKINFDFLHRLKNLEKLSLIDSGSIPNLSFVKNLPKLKFLVFSKTNVIDGDLSYCEGIEYVAFDNKKHYSHKSKDIDQKICLQRLERL
ncbi:hypothetical protein [Cohnella terricola]|uniref:Leucine-rich repeat domain-containing protein n=1 Tax=Cohnella terricola TaxID=1289167 RepID=A0A559JWE4_9BACL|nr:hypothetical protein [Cohnella terricola]TVY04208.1 hypothetical protein FPZ45_01000 [Cohnella terricola]